MNTADVSTLGLIASLLLVVVAIAISTSQRLGLEREIVWATVRSLIQLLFVGAILAFVIDPGQPLILSWAWVVAMIAFAGVVIRRRAPEIPFVLPLGVASIGAAVAITLAVIFGLGVFPLEGRTLVPLAGMMVGNSMNATVLAARRVVDEFRDHQPEIEARLALGQSSAQAGRRYIRAALRTALTPQIETTKAVGLVFLPGAMTGLILAGVDPLEAVRVQAAIMYLILGSVATTATVMTLGIGRRLFTPDHRLVPLPRPAERP
ncbi:MAG: iron export ABC transporter permease subunit FetB [Acidimicrobiia bacterium]|nr:iron export ABC transporter permease subunit FetB [Acidimicrobiia bacterium]